MACDLRGSGGVSVGGGMPARDAAGNIAIGNNMRRWRSRAPAGGGVPKWKYAAVGR